MARPTAYTLELGERICAELAQGVSLRTVCKADDMPCVATVFNWFRVHPEFLEHYARAKEESADAMAEEILDIADNAANDYMEALDKDGQAASWRFNGEHIQRSRLRVDTRKFLMAKMKPKRYGDKVDLNVGGQAGNPLLTDNLFKIEFINADSKDKP